MLFNDCIMEDTSFKLYIIKYLNILLAVYIMYSCILYNAEN